MATTNFTNGVTLTDADWFNDVDEKIYQGTVATGTVTRRTLEDRAADLVNVKDFGAVGDGVTEDSTAFENAVATGKRVYVPEGTYLVNVLDLPSNTFIYGDGEPSVIKPYDTTLRGALGCNSGGASTFITGLVFKDFKMLGPVATLGFSEQRHLMDLHGVKRCLIENVIFEGMQGDGLYVGAGTSGQERHNHDVVVRGCTFEGLINDNRQGCSVIDVDGMLVEGCVFRNCARSNMPGSLDFEPDDSADVIKNVRVVNNKFYNTDGNRGHVCIQTQNTLNVENIVVSGNHFDDVPSGSAGVTLSLSDTTPSGPHRIIIEGNTFDLSGSRGIYKIDGVVSGLTIRGNVINALTGVWLTYITAENANENIVIEGNTFLEDSAAGSSAILLNDTFANVAIRGNLFEGTPTRHIFLVGTTYTGTSITDNDFVGAASSAVIATSITTPNAITNVLLGNRFENNAVVQFSAARSDYAGNVANPSGADEASAPSVFNPGISRVRISSRTIAGATQSGILETYALVGTGYTAHFQLFYPDYSASYADKIYFRKAVNSSTWDSWYLIGGALTGSATYDPPNLADGAGATTTVTVTGAALGDFAEASFSLDLQGITVTAWVSATNTVSVRFQNESGGALDLGSGTLRASVRKL